MGGCVGRVLFDLGLVFDVMGGRGWYLPTIYLLYYLTTSAIPIPAHGIPTHLPPHLLVHLSPSLLSRTMSPSSFVAPSRAARFLPSRPSLLGNYSNPRKQRK